MIKEHLPLSVREYLSGLRAAVVGRRVFSHDKRRFLATYANRSLKTNSQKQLEGRLIFHAHSLEKGLSHSIIKYGFGVRALTRLAKSLSVYNSAGYDKNTKAYKNALSVIKAYIDLHRDAGSDVAHLKDIFTESLLDEAENDKSALGGVESIAAVNKQGNREKNFKELFLNRWSIREYSKTPVDVGLIHEAIEIATKSPSICNRQSGRVRIIQDKKVMESALAIQRGMRGYDLPQALLLVTTDSSSFLDLTERNQVYIDGGLFAMSLLMSLEYVSLAACPLNAMFTVKREKQMRRLLQLPEEENIIMFVAVGNFKEVNKMPKSFRYGREDIILR